MADFSAETLLRQPVHSTAYRELCDCIFWCNSEPYEHPLPAGAHLVFCKIDEVWRLFRRLRRGRRRMVLVTGEGDRPVSSNLWRQKPAQVASWLGINMFVTDSQARGLPLGLGEPGELSTLEWEEIRAALRNPPPRTGLLYGNFGTFSNPAIRKPLLDWMNQPEQAWITRDMHQGGAGKQRYLHQLLSHEFVLCPPGNGEDTHRMWEALYCGAIPVVRSSAVLRQFPDLPVVEVDDFCQLTPEFLKMQQARLANSQPRLDYCWRDYWQEVFSRTRAGILQKPNVSTGEWVASWIKEIWRVATHP